MAQRFYNPLTQIVDSAGVPLSGAQLFFYETGTSTKLDTYSDEPLSSANANPVVLDSLGRLPSDVWLKNQDYKVVLAPSTDTDPPTSAIWTADPVRSSDFDTFEKMTVGDGDPNGSVAGTASSAGVLPDVYWDFTNDILYYCTTTGNAAAAVWTALNAASATAAVPSPQGRLTVTSGVPVISTDSPDKASVFYMPYTGNLIPIYNGTSFIPTTFAELTLTLVAGHASGNIYDVYVWSESGVVTIGTSPVWSTITAGSGARGTGASTAELARVQGMLVNANAMTMTNSTNTFSVGANLGTYVGTILMSANGQVSCDTAFGQSKEWGVWNAYNRKPIVILIGDATATWAYATGTIRQSRATAGNALIVLTGLAEEWVDLDFRQKFVSSNAATTAAIGIGVNSTTAFSGQAGGGGSTPGGSHGVLLSARHMLPPGLGLNNINACEIGSGAGTNTFNGGQENMQLVAKYLG